MAGTRATQIVISKVPISPFSRTSMPIFGVAIICFLVMEWCNFWEWSSLENA